MPLLSSLLPLISDFNSTVLWSIITFFCYTYTNTSDRPFSIFNTPGCTACTYYEGFYSIFRCKWSKQGSGFNAVCIYHQPVLAMCYLVSQLLVCAAFCSEFETHIWKRTTRLCAVLRLCEFAVQWIIKQTEEYGEIWVCTFPYAVYVFVISLIVGGVLYVFSEFDTCLNRTDCLVCHTDGGEVDDKRILPLSSMLSISVGILNAIRYCAIILTLCNSVRVYIDLLHCCAICTNLHC